MTSSPVRPLRWPLLNIWAGWWVAGGLALLLSGCSGPTPRPTETAAPPADRVYAYDGGSLQARRSAGTCELQWQGAVHPGALQRLRDAFADQQPLPCERRVVVLNAVEGTIGDAITAGAMVRNRGWDTALAPGSACRTPCWLVFAAGTQRHMPDGPPPARVVFSQVPPDADFGHQSCATELSRPQQLTLTRYLRAMLPPTTATTVYQKLLAADCRSADAYDPQQARLIGLATGAR